MVSLDFTFSMYLRFKGPQDHFETSFWELFGYLWGPFCGFGGFWEVVGILMYFGASPGEAQIERTRSRDG